MISLDVLGIPAPKGSSRAIVRGKRAVLIPCSSDAGKRKMQTWTAVVAWKARLATHGKIAFVDAALTVSIVFRMPRPRGHYGARGLFPSSPAFPATKPDVDKLARSTLDALTGIVWDDDSRIVVLSVAKVYAEPGREGASIVVTERQVGDVDWMTAHQSSARAQSTPGDDLPDVAPRRQTRVLGQLDATTATSMPHAATTGGRT